MRKFARKVKKHPEAASSAVEPEVTSNEAAQKILDHFDENGQGLTPQEKAIQDLKEVLEEGIPVDAADEHLGKLSYTELCEELLKQYHEADREAKRWQEIRDSLRKEIVHLTGQERGTIQRGAYVLRIQDRGSSVSFDWRQYIEDELGRASLIQIENEMYLCREGKQTWKYAKLGKPSVVIDVSKAKNSGGAPAVGAPEAR